MWTRGFSRDAGFAFRTIWRSKLFALLAVVVFAFGIGASATVFSAVDAVLLHPATYPNPESVVSIQASGDQKDWGSLPPSVFARVLERHDLFAQVAAWQTTIFTVTRVPVPDQVFGMVVSGDFFPMLAAHAWRGRTLLPADDRAGAAPVALLSYRAWRQLFAGRAEVVGKTAQIDGNTYTIAGIMAADFVTPAATPEVWTTMRLTPAQMAAGNARSVNVVARLQPSIGVGRVQAALTSVQLPPVRPSHVPVRLRAVPFHEEAALTYRLTLWLAMGMVSVLLLIACANLSSFLLARAVGRRRDFAIRLATGARRIDLVRQSLLEVLTLSLTGLLIAYAAAEIALHIIRESLLAAQIGIPDLARIELNGRSLLFAFGVAFVAALLCGVVPAAYTSSGGIASGIREAGTQVAGGRMVRKALHLLIAAEAGLTILLLLTSALLVRSLVRLVSEDHGLRTDHVLTMRLPTGAWQLVSVKRDEDFQRRMIEHYTQFLRQAETTPGVDAAALASSLPLSHTVVTTRLRVPSSSNEIGPVTQAVTRNYFRVMGIPVLAGRSFDLADANSKLRVMLVNQAFARKYFDGENPIGKFLEGDDKTYRAEIIGVVKDSPHLDVEEAVQPEVYSDFAQTLLTPFLTGVVIRTRGEPNALAATLRKRLNLQDSEQPVVQIHTLRELIDENIWRPRFSAWFFSWFAGIALMLASVGTYGVVAYVAALSRRDYAIRLALGASPTRIFRFVTYDNLIPVACGIVAGLGAFYWISGWIASLLYKTSRYDAVSLIVGCSVLLLCAIGATVAPAIRAAKTEPAITLRSE